MQRRTLLMLGAATLLVAGCGSRLNPLNLFRRPSREAEPLSSEIAMDAEGRPLIDQITALSLEQTPSGAILRATGLPPTQGYFDGELIQVGEVENGQLEFEFRVRPPLEPRSVSTVQSREVIVGVALPGRLLAETRQIRVSAARNARSIGR